MKTQLISREVIVTEIKRIIQWAIEERRLAHRLLTDENRRVHLKSYQSYLLCAWTLGKVLR